MEDVTKTQIDQGKVIFTTASGQYSAPVTAVAAPVPPPPAPTPTPTPTPAPVPVPAPSPAGGIWISPAELAALPTTGAAWTAVKAAADSAWGVAALDSNDSAHDVKTLAGALVAARTGDAAMKAKTIAGLKSAMVSPLSRALELGRGLQAYVIAADVIGYTDAAFKTWVAKMINAPIPGHDGVGILGTAERTATNWGGHARASLAAAALYLGDADWRDKVVKWHKGYLDGSHQFVWDATTWHASTPKRGVNAKGAMRGSVNLSGSIPEDWRRESVNFVWPPAYSEYMWEGMQGFVVCAAILHRAGLVPFSFADNGVERAMNMLYGMGEAASNSPVFRHPAANDDTWIPYVVNKFGSTKYPVSASITSGKGMGYTNWTHA